MAADDTGREPIAIEASAETRSELGIETWWIDIGEPGASPSETTVARGYDGSDQPVVELTQAILAPDDMHRVIEVSVGMKSGDAKIRIEAAAAVAGADTKLTLTMAENTFLGNDRARRAVERLIADTQSQSPRFLGAGETPLVTSSSPIRPRVWGSSIWNKGKCLFTKSCGLTLLATTGAAATAAYSCASVGVSLVATATCVGATGVTVVGAAACVAGEAAVLGGLGPTCATSAIGGVKSASNIKKDCSCKE